jgi:putative methyltransferase (TIGR04325 family)
MELNRIIPPLFLDLVKSRRQNPSRIYSDYQTALQDCELGVYENEKLTHVVVEKNHIFRNAVNEYGTLDLGAMRTLAAVGFAKKTDELNVIDFGGAGGYHHTVAKLALGSDVKLRWNVVETPMMAKAAQRLSNSELNFFENIDEASRDLSRVDLVFTSGALQYCPKPIEVLKRLMDIGATHFVITRTAFTQEESSLTTIQYSNLSDNGPGPLPAAFKDSRISYPVVFEPLKMAETLIRRQYEIKFHTLEDKGVYLAGSKLINMYGYFCNKLPS